MSYRILNTISIALISTMTMWSQMDTIPLSNPSFEGEPHAGLNKKEQLENQGRGYSLGIRFWRDCGAINFPYESAPDLHGDTTTIFDHTWKPSHGSSYLGMVSRSNDTYEAVSQRLISPLESGKCYELKIDLMRSNHYLSATKEGGKNLRFNYNKPIILYLYGGTGLCGDQELLAQSPYIKNTDWETYTLSFSPSRKLKYITLEVSYKRPTLNPYNGNILVDNLRPIIQVPCPGEEPEIVATTVEAKTEVPPHKRRKQTPKPKKEVTTTTTTVEVSPAKAEKPKVLDLDRKNIKTNQRIEIKNLYFEADKSIITDGSEEVLLEVFDFLKDNNDITIEVGGHTNGMPAHDFCDKLSRNRAKEVATYLVRKGIEPSRITYKGYGKRRPVASNQTIAGRKKNQRVEITITAMDS